MYSRNYDCIIYVIISALLCKTVVADLCINLSDWRGLIEILYISGRFANKTMKRVLCESYSDYFSSFVIFTSCRV